LAKVKTFLAARVRESFRDVPAPDKITTLPENEDCDSAWAADTFRGKHWSELTPQLVQSCPDAIVFLSPEAFRFFLPGYLLLALQDLYGMDVSLSSLLWALAGPYYEERFSLLTEDQLLTVLAVLDAVAPDETDPTFWEFAHAKEGVLEYLTRP